MDILTSNVQVWHLVLVVVLAYIGLMLVWPNKSEAMEYVTKDRFKKEIDELWNSRASVYRMDTAERAINNLFETMTKNVGIEAENISIDNEWKDDLTARIEHLETPAWKRKVAEWLGLSS